MDLMELTASVLCMADGADVSFGADGVDGAAGAAGAGIADDVAERSNRAD